MSVRHFIIAYASHFLGTFYSWGGDDPSAFDCSGLIVELLKSVGTIERGADYSAAQLYNMFTPVEKPDAGILAFWKNEAGDIIHVELCINPWMTIGASGGGSRVKTKEDAIKANAFVKVRPLRKYAVYADPFKDYYYGSERNAEN